MGGIGLLAGVFDPFHQGHIRLAEKAAARFNLSKVLVLPLLPDTQRAPQTPLEARRQMAREGMKGHPLLAMMPLPAKRDTMPLHEAIRFVLKTEQPSSLYVLLGARRLEKILLWPGVGDIAKRCSFVAFETPGCAGERMAASVMALAGARVTLMPAVYPMTDTVRRQIALYNDAETLLPRGVARLIAQNGFYLPKYEETLKTMMTPGRLAHTLSVRATAAELAYIHRAPIIRAGVAGMLHDCAKGMPLKAMREIALRENLTREEAVLASGALLHGPVGARVAETAFGIRDEGILSAIACHTTGKANMSALDLCVFVADAIEPLRRDYEGLSEIRALAHIDLRLAAIKSMEGTRRYVLAQGGRYGGQSAQALDDLLHQISYQGGIP